MGLASLCAWDDFIPALVLISQLFSMIFVVMVRVHYRLRRPLYAFWQSNYMICCALLIMDQPI